VAALALANAPSSDSQASGPVDKGEHLGTDVADDHGTTSPNADDAVAADLKDDMRDYFDSREEPQSADADEEGSSPQDQDQDSVYALADGEDWSSF